MSVEKVVNGITGETVTVNLPPVSVDYVVGGQGLGNTSSYQRRRSGNGLVVLSTDRKFFYDPAPHGIDVLYTWVNGSEPFRKEQYQQYKHEAKYQSAHSDNRFREWKELYYSLQLLYKHATNLRNVVVVSAGERPYYAHQFPQLVWVNHSDFLPEHILPTFNSVAIEFGLYYLLPRLSDPFIAMNDDWFIRKPMDLKERANQWIWYEDSSVIQPTEENKKQLHLGSFITSNEAIKKVFPQHQPEHVMSHSLAVVRHETLSFIFNTEMKEAAEKSLKRFRSFDGMQFQYTLANVERYRNRDKIKFMSSAPVLDFLCCTEKAADLESISSRILRSQKPFLCVNDDIRDPKPEHGAVLHWFFESLIDNNTVAAPHVGTITHSVPSNRSE